MIRRKLYFVAALSLVSGGPEIPALWMRISSGRFDFRNASAKLSMELGLARTSGMNFRVRDFFEISPGFFDIAGADDEDRPRFRENARGLQTDTGVAAGYNCNLSAKFAAAKRLLAGRLRSESRSIVIGLLLYLFVPSPWGRIPMACISSHQKDTKAPAIR